MSRNRAKNGKPENQDQPELIQAESVIGKRLTKKLEDNIQMIRDMFFNDDTIVIRQFGSQNNGNVQCCMVMVDGMINHEVSDMHIMKPIIGCRALLPHEDAFETIRDKVISVDEIKVSSDAEKLAESIIGGETALFVDGYAKAMILNTRGWLMRGVQEPAPEKVIRGPREGFVESILMNLSMIRRKIASPDLKFKFKTIGARTHTKICIVYHEALVNHDILAEVVRRISGYNLDGALDAQYVEEMIRDSPYSPFQTVGSTERPDIVAAKILEGRIAVFVDGTPAVLTVPYVFIESFQVNEDYYLGYVLSSFVRIVRILAFLLTISIPAIYLSLVAFHQELLPSPLLYSILTARENVPFPTIVELLIMLATFEVLREAGARMSTGIGQALSIVGALVLGQAAVEAKIVSAPIIIIVAFTAICDMIGIKHHGAVVLVRLVSIAACALIGLYGYFLTMAALGLFLLNTRSFGVPYMLSMSSFDPQDLKDTYVRAPWWHMKLRPKFMARDMKRSGKA
ncbi:MAG: spore germination protein [Bacillota bacterium]